MIRTADVRTDSDARQWEARLNREWPQRQQVAAWIVTQITSESISSPRVVELACGAGYLAEVLLRQLPTARYYASTSRPICSTTPVDALLPARRRLGSPVKSSCAALIWCAQTGKKS